MEAAAIRTLVVKLASRCNLACNYCYIYKHEDTSWRSRPAFMADDVFDAMLARMVEHCDPRPGHRMSLVFHGGEPTLLPASRFETLIARARRTLGGRLAGLSMQSNALRLTGDWLRAIEVTGVNVAVSLDGPPEVHDRVRIDHAGRGSHAATVAGLSRLVSIGVEPQVLCVVQPGTDGLAAFRHFLDLGVRHMNFLLPDVSHDNKARWYGDFGPAPVADYLLPIFEDWFLRDDPGIRVVLFWELLSRLMGGPGVTDCFGNPRMSYLIIETDGAIEALDALRVCEPGMGDSGLTVREHGFDDLALGRPLVHQAVHLGFPLCATCRACPHAGTCGGGFLPHRYARSNGFDNPSVWCGDIQILLRRLRRAIDDAVVA